jgi:hypothetical protein
VRDIPAQDLHDPLLMTFLRRSLACALLLSIARDRAVAQEMEASRFGGAHLREPPSLPALMAEAPRGACERPMAASIGAGAAGGAVTMALVVIVASPFLALSSGLSGNKVNLTPYFVGAVVVGGVVGGVSHSRQCGRLWERRITAQTGLRPGRYVDDYDNTFEITDSLFAQLPHGRFHIVEWHREERFVIAFNDLENPSAPGRWTRIDWMPFTGMEPYTWGFCLTAYDAPSRVAARETPPPDRTNPRKGCNGYPFSRMKPAP